MELSFNTTLQVPVAPSRVCFRNPIAALPMQNRMSVFTNTVYSSHQRGIFPRKMFSPRPMVRVSATDDTSTPVDQVKGEQVLSESVSGEGDRASSERGDGEESKVLSERDSEEGEKAETDEEYNRRLHQDVQKKADQLLKDAIDNFVHSDIEDANKKYDMEEELFSEIDFAQINAFTDQPFSGNPAAVCYLPLKRSEEWMQLVAREFNLSETAFLKKRSTKQKRSSVFKKSTEEIIAEQNIVDEFDLRWFTPKLEVDLCGHATLASAHLLFTTGIASSETILFHTKSGVLKAKKVSGYDKDRTRKEGKSAEMKTENSKGMHSGDSEDPNKGRKLPVGVGVVELDFPLITCSECNNTEIQAVSTALGGVKFLWAGKTSSDDYLVEVASRKEMEDIQPEFVHMLGLSGRGVIVTSSAESDVDFVSRFFAPKCGINEDPVTGSAHCALGPFWAEKLGKTTLKAYQASERGGYVEVRVDKCEGRVYLQGSSVLVMAGVLLNTMRARLSSK
ncbi:hypothetical protein KP509_1Z011900 [Ceratopteris richardii]|nr:hypothetical protein KP509_1Z011900 [Ceratopteris richardii]